MPRKQVSDEIKQEILRKHLDEGRTVKSLCDEYFLAHSTIERWITEYRKECQEKPKLKEQSEIYEENRKLRKELEELKKENEFLKKSSGILCEGNRLAQYEFIRFHSGEFGTRWLLSKFGIYPNAYYRTGSSLTMPGSSISCGRSV